MTRTGKVARLPRAVRDALNRRLQDGESGPPLLNWLNALPEVQSILAADFGGRPLNAQNLSDWRRGGYRDWLAQQEAMELTHRLAEDAAELQPDDRPALSDTLAIWLAARYALAARDLTQAEGAGSWEALHRLCADVAELRRGDHTRERLRLMREHVAATRERTKREQIEEFWKWADSDVREQICRGFMTGPEKMQWLGRKIFGDDWDILEAAAGRDAADPACGTVSTSCPTGEAHQGESR